MRQAAALASRGITADHQFVPTGIPHRPILASVLHLRPDLVVKDIHDSPREDWLAFLPEEERMLDYCPLPVMLVRPESGRW